MKILSYHLTVPPETRIKNISEGRIIGINGTIISFGVKIEQSADAYVGAKIKINDNQFMPHTSVKEGSDDLIYFSGYGIIIDNVNYKVNANDFLNVFAENVDVVPHRIDIFFIIKE